MRVLIIGSGAREHTLAWKISQGSKADKIFAAPGNAGTAQIGENIEIAPEDTSALIKTAQENRIDLVMVGPESPLTQGIVDSFHRVSIPAFGPTQKAARIEGSKSFAKELMIRHNLPCAESATFDSFREATCHLEGQSYPIVIKADGLAAGKGVIIAETESEATEALRDIMEKRLFGDAGNKVIIEECLFGREASMLVFADGKTAIPMVTACDYKRAFESDKGPNTGGMGSYAPSEFLTDTLISQVMDTIINPTIKAMAQEGMPYKGVLYAGLMITSDGPKLLEFNARFGDPETQVILPLLKTDLVDIMQAVIDERLDQVNCEWSNESCVGVVMASAGYPGSHQTGFPISGLDTVDDGVLVFHAGTRKDTAGRIVTSGGRVLTVVATGKNYTEAGNKAYKNVSRIDFSGCYYRKDIALITNPNQGEK